MKLRSTLRSSAIARLFTLGVTTLGVTTFGATGCGDDEVSEVTTVDAGNPLSPTDTSDLSSTSTDTSATDTALTGVVTPAETSSGEGTTAPVSSDSDLTSTEVSSASVGSETAASSSAASTASSGPVVVETSSAPVVNDTTEVVEPCSIPSFAVFSRSDSDASWDDNDFSSVQVDSSQCPPAVYVDTTWPHEEGWAFGDPSEANHEQVHFTLDSYGASNLVNKEITATVELVADERGPNANAGGYLISIVSVSTFDRVTVIPAEVEPDAGPDASTPEPTTITETGYSEAESAPKDRILLRRAGDRATVSFRLPAKTEAVDSYDPERVLKINLRVYNVYEGLAPVSPVDPEPLDAGAASVFDAAAADPSADASTGESVVAIVAPPAVEGDPSLVYDYLTSRFAITKFTITDVAAE